MSDGNYGGGSADQTGTTHDHDEVWDHWAFRLAMQLMRMTDDDDRLIIELPDGHDGEASPYAQFGGFGDGHMLRAELAGNVHLPQACELSAEECDTLELMGWRGNDEEEPNWFVDRPVAHAKGTAALVVGALRAVFGVAHPHLLTYEAWGPNAAGATDLGR